MKSDNVNSHAKYLEALVSRICHDLINPVAALQNGLELMKEGDQALQKDAMQLMTNSAHKAARTLQFFRMTFGSMSSAGGAVKLEDVRSMICQMAEHAGIDIKWNVEANDAAPNIARALLLLADSTIRALVRGGEIHVSTPAANSVELLASGKVFAMQEELSELFTTDNPASLPIAPRTVNALQLHAIAAEVGGKLIMSSGKNSQDYPWHRLALTAI